ncbi:hypothetical protein [Polyangium sorediatum]|uniref:Uncharacterized protein n=1 Tax=Polyangium sorediatum TaxID=889274 RepID=A0ABT6P2S2_9BACT|nr:hypothetical protein [Polyangium sorediatum]MDI1434878.1 hypothetical protein [Polyangium sorediatum]
MPTFKLSTAFTQEDLNRFYASGSNIVVAKPNAGGMPNVAWLVYRPLLGNTVTWEEQYGIYASNVDIINGAQLTQMSKSEFPALDNKSYPLTAAGFFGPPSTGGSPGSYTAVNQYDNLPKGYLTFGLFQDAVVDGTPALGNAVSAAPVIYNSTAVMTPFTTVYLWVQSQVVSNTVVTNVTSPMTEVMFGGPVTEVSLMYDASSGKFITAPGKTMAEKAPLRHHLPSLA